MKSRSLTAHVSVRFLILHQDLTNTSARNQFCLFHISAIIYDLQQIFSSADGDRGVMGGSCDDAVDILHSSTRSACMYNISFHLPPIAQAHASDR